MKEKSRRMSEGVSNIQHPVSNMHQLIFATGNPHKIREVEQLLTGRFEVLGLKDIDCREELPETRPTIVGNALQKAEYVHEHYGVDCFSEDSGLEIDALQGAPGVYSARYAGEGRNSDDNIDLVLQQMAGATERSARFRTVIALILNGETHTFEGVAEGTILGKRSGSGGFGYDPIFRPLGYQQTFAEMDAATKNAISHRGKAVRKLVEFLQSL